MITPHKPIKSQDLKAGMTVRNSLGKNVELEHVEVFPARYVRAGWHMPACVLVFYGGNRRFSHTFHFDELLELVEDDNAQTNLVLHSGEKESAGAQTDHAATAEGEQGEAGKTR